MTDTSDVTVLLVNLGTPTAPTPRAVRRFLSEFLHDHRVVQLTRWLWCPLLHGLILPLRGPKVAAKYAAIWMEGGSPLAVHTQDLATALQQRLPQFKVSHAMRYGEPTLSQALKGSGEGTVSRVLVLPLYPQYSSTTTASIADVIAAVIAAVDSDAHMIDDYHRDPGWIAAIAGSIQEHWTRHGRSEHLLMSFHGLPQRLVDAGDPYATQCIASAHAIASALDLDDTQWTLAFQSRFGRERWLQPSTSDALDALAVRGVRSVDAVCPGFATDCLETLEEVAIMLAEQFHARGGTLRYVPCLNASPAHVEALAQLVQREVATW
ncbi:MAG: ferrochelatase [Luteimonas sp.]